MTGVDNLSTFNPEKLSVNFINETTLTQPVIPRRYTLTHSDVTGELFLDIGTNFAWEKINPTRDEVLGEWRLDEHCLWFFINIYIDQGEFPIDAARKRNEIFKRELPTALTAIRYSDRSLFTAHPYLDYAPILIQFNSQRDSLKTLENWGTFEHFTEPNIR